MCNLCDIGPAPHRSCEDWEEIIMKALRQLEKPFGIRKTDPGLVLASSGSRMKVETMRGDLNKLPSRT